MNENSQSEDEEIEVDGHGVGIKRGIPDESLDAEGRTSSHKS